MAARSRLSRGAPSRNVPHAGRPCDSGDLARPAPTKANKCCFGCLLLADIVAKRFCPSERARLIQDLAPMRNLDSRNGRSRFDCCRILFHRTFAETFTTKSARTGQSAMSAFPPLTGVKRTFNSSDPLSTQQPSYAPQARS